MPEHQRTMVYTFDSELKERDMSDVQELEKLSGVKIPLDLKGNLEVWSKNFEGLRYIYEMVENGKTTHMMFFPEIEQSVLTIIYEIRPEWKSLS